MEYIPVPIVTDIVRRVGKEGFRYLAPFITAGPEWQKIVFSNEVLSEVCLEEFLSVSSWCNIGSPYRLFLLRCLEAGNRTAKYVEGLRRLAQLPPSTESLDMLGGGAVHYLNGRFAFGVFLICCGNFDEGEKVLQSFLAKVSNFEEAFTIAENVCTRIEEMGTQGTRVYDEYMYLKGFPACNLFHHTAIDVCVDCFVLNYVWKIAAMC